MIKKNTLVLMMVAFCFGCGKPAIYPVTGELETNAPPGFQLQTDGKKWRYYDMSDGMTLVNGAGTRKGAVDLAWEYYRAKTNGDTGDFPHDERWNDAP